MIIFKSSFKSALNVAKQHGYIEGGADVARDVEKLLASNATGKATIDRLEKLNAKLCRDKEMDGASLRGCRAEVDRQRLKIEGLKLDKVELAKLYRDSQSENRQDTARLTAERLELRQTVNSLTVQLGDAQMVLRGAADLSKGHKVKLGSVYDVNSLYPSPIPGIKVLHVPVPEPKAYCVMKCVKEFPGAIVRKMPITADETLEYCLTTVNANNEINQEPSVHYEIQVF